VRLLGARPDASRIRWAWEPGRSPVYVEIDRGQMEQALLNIFNNAIEAVNGEGTITVRVTPGTARTTLTIEDSGPGIAPEAQSNLFTPFFSTKPHGQGIGLTLIQEVLAGHGFHYALERTADNTTRFTIVLGPQVGALAHS
jgi:signal transduction histidine kinase